MTSAAPDLMLYLKLDQLQNGKVVDASPHGHAGTIHGNVVPVPDDTFGYCLSFEGQAEIELPALSLPLGNSSHTIEAWVKVENYPPGRSWILVLGQAGGGAHHWLLGSDSSTQLGAWNGAQTNPTLPKGVWTHVAMTYDQGQLRCYLNGALYGEPQAAGFNFTTANFVIARKQGSELSFQGRLAHVRLYSRALSPQEIKRDMAADQRALPTFREAHPLAFSLYDDDNHYILYIDDNPVAGHTLNLELHNTSAKDIQLLKADQVTADQYHFELRFRPKILSPQTLELLKTQKEKVLNGPGEWDLYVPAETQPTDMVSLYLLYKGQAPVFKANERRLLKLHHLSAAAAGGARTTRVELRPLQIAYVGDDQTPIAGSRIQSLHISNQRGRKDIPLHVGFLGSNRILNDGSSKTDLALHLTNVIQPHREHYTNPTISLRADTAQNRARGIPASHLYLSFPVYKDGGDEVGALCKDTQLKDFTLSAKLVKRGSPEKPDILTPTPVGGNLGQSRQWALVPKEDIVLRPGDYLQIDLKGFVSSLRPGLANLYLHYEDIPGYWDGQFVCPIEKAPLLFQNGKVGIGTPTPGAGLEINKGTTNELALRLTSAGPGWGSGIQFANTAPSGKTYGIYTDQQGLLHFADQNNQVDRLVIDKAGKVGIGTAKPAETLEVNGNIKLTGWGKGIQFIDTTAYDKFVAKGTIETEGYSAIRIGFPGSDFGGRLVMGRWSTSSTPVFEELMRLGSDGNLGLGTPSPGAKLEVNQGTTNNLALRLTSSGPGWGSGIQFTNTAPNGKSYGIYTDQQGLLRFADQNNQVDRLVIDKVGNVGIGLTNPAQKFVISSNHNAGKQAESGLQYGGSLAIVSDAPQIDFIDTDNNDWSIHVNSNRMYFVRQPWNYQDLVLDGAGKVGIGTDVPDQKLTVSGGHVQVERNQLLGHKISDQFTYDGKKMGHYSLGWFDDTWLSSGSTAWISGYAGLKFFTNGSPKLTIDYHGNIRYEVSLQKSSSRELKKNIVDFPVQEAFTILAGLKPVKYSLKADSEKRTHLGFIAEEVPALVASPDGKAISMDEIVTVLAGVVKEQQERISALKRKVEALEQLCFSQGNEP